jgi:hypothetical protein
MIKLFEIVLDTDRIYSKAGATLNNALKRLNVRGYDIIYFGDEAENNPPDVQKMPDDQQLKDFDLEFFAYGRWGVGEIPGQGEQFFIDGGTSPSRTGHPNWIKRGGYYAGAIRRWDDDADGVIFVRGRGNTTEDDMKHYISRIIDEVSKKCPKLNF